MCQQNLPKLWCRYEFIVHNHLRNSEIVPQWIQQKISTENIQYLKNGSRIQKSQIAKTPFNYTIAAQTLLAECDDYRFQRLIFQYPALGKSYHIASMFIITRVVSTPRDVERRESGSMFCETIEIIPWSSYESSRKHENIALKCAMTKQWSSLIQQ